MENLNLIILCLTCICAITMFVELLIRGKNSMLLLFCGGFGYIWQSSVNYASDGITPDTIIISIVGILNSIIFIFRLDKKNKLWKN